MLFVRVVRRDSSTVMRYDVGQCVVLSTSGCLMAIGPRGHASTIDPAGLRVCSCTVLENTLADLNRRLLETLNNYYQRH